MRARSGLLALAALICLPALAGGCRVDAAVSLSGRGGDRGTVAVTVSLDRGALAALGGQEALAAQISVADLTRAGWRFSGPTPLPGGGAKLVVSHVFSDPAEAARLLAEVAGSGPVGNRPFRLTLTSHQGLVHTSTFLEGRIDLGCGLACFGDPGLQSLFGHPNGVAASPLFEARRDGPGQVFHLSFSAHLPGQIRADDATRREGSTLIWVPQLGKSTRVFAAVQGLDVAHLAGAGAAGVVGAAGAGVWLYRRRRHGRGEGPRRAAHARRGRRPRLWRLWPGPWGKRPGPGQVPTGETVTGGP